MFVVYWNKRISNIQFHWIFSAIVISEKTEKKIFSDTQMLSENKFINRNRYSN